MKPIKVKYRKLGREQAAGQAHIKDRLIEIDDRLKKRTLLTTLIHEIMHIQNPDWSESEVEKKSSEMSAVLWEQHYRRVDN